VSGIEGAVAAGVVKLAIERGGRPGIDKALSLLRGKTLMVVGPPRSGKSTFLDYVRYGVFQHEQETQKTYRPQNVQDFRLAIGPDKALKVAIRKAIDIPGQWTPKDLAREVFDRRPHALIVMLDLSAPLDDPNDSRSAAIWLRDFCSEADIRAHATKAKKNRLRVFIVALNKADLVSEEILAQRQAAFEQIVDDRWRTARGQHHADPMFRRCVAVQNDDGTRWVDAILVDVAKAMVHER
jgi:hypothetical protein